MTDHDAIKYITKARKLLRSASDNRVKATRMQSDCATAGRLRDRACRQEDEAADLFWAVTSYLEGAKA